jgi:hypothetical protein
MNNRILYLAKKFKKQNFLSSSNLSDDEIKEFSNLLNLNPFYVKNPSSWDIMESILLKVYWKLYPDGTLPNNWLDIFK